VEGGLQTGLWGVSYLRGGNGTVLYKHSTVDYQREADSPKPSPYTQTKK